MKKSDVTLKNDEDGEIIALGYQEDLDWLKTRIEKKSNRRHRARIGPSDNDEKQVKLANKRITWTKEGIEIENSRHALVEGNIAHDNTGGILVFITPGLPIKTSYDAIVRRNTVINNNTPNFAIPGSLVSTIPAGTVVRVPYGWGADKGELGGPGEPGSEPATIRVAEILSLQRLFYEGQMLNNAQSGSRQT